MLAKYWFWVIGMSWVIINASRKIPKKAGKVTPPPLSFPRIPSCVALYFWILKPVQLLWILEFLEFI